MPITPMELTGMVTKANDITMRTHDDNRMFADTSHAQAQVAKNADNKQNTVLKKDNAEHHEYNYDAKEKSQNSYEGNSNKQKKKKEEDGKVIIKGQSSGFDLKI